MIGNKSPAPHMNRIPARMRWLGDAAVLSIIATMQGLAASLQQSRLAQFTYRLGKRRTELAPQRGRQARGASGIFRGAGADQLVEHALGGRRDGEPLAAAVGLVLAAREEAELEQAIDHLAGRRQRHV